MRTSVRAAVVAVVLALPVLIFSAAPASAAAIFLEANPDTAPAGDEIGLRASCTDNLKEAAVSGAPLGQVTVRPNGAFLTATIPIPTATKPGDYQLTLVCPDGQRATTTLHVVAKVTPSQGPATGGGGTAPGRSAPLMIGGGLTAIAAGLVLAVVTLRRRRAA
jgi:hypothetical protein